MGKIASVSDPTIAPSTLATNRMHVGEAMISARASLLGAGFDEDNCGIRVSNAETNSSVTMSAFSTTTAIPQPCHTTPPKTVGFGE
jgi:hypothetical protein